MRRWSPLCIGAFCVALGCSSNDFDIAETPDSGSDTGVAGDTSLTTDTTIGDDSNVPPPDSSGPDTIGGPDTLPLDMGASDTPSTTCARTGDCPANHYCKFKGCETVGVCAPLSPLPGPYFEPVCGCDSITYWNKEHAYVQSAPIAHDGPCALSERKPCTGAGTVCDAPDSVCIVQLPNAAACTSPDLYGGCWRMPTGIACSTLTGPPVMTCAGVCLSQCAAVKSKTSKFYPASCTTT